MNNAAEWIKISLICSGALTTLVTLIISTYIVALYAHLDGLVEDVRCFNKRVGKRFFQLVWS